MYELGLCPVLGIRASWRNKHEKWPRVWPVSQTDRGSSSDSAMCSFCDQGQRPLLLLLWGGLCPPQSYVYILSPGLCEWDLI